jgi:hypothetical protein
LLLTEVLKLSQHSLPQSISAGLQVLPDLLPAAIRYDADKHEISTATIYQIESIHWLDQVAYRVDPEDMLLMKIYLLHCYQETQQKTD